MADEKKVNGPIPKCCKGGHILLSSATRNGEGDLEGLVSKACLSSTKEISHRHCKRERGWDKPISVCQAAWSAASSGVETSKLQRGRSQIVPRTSTTRMATTNVIKRNIMANKADQLNFMNYHCMPAILYAAVFHMVRFSQK